jgi:hypothetical protein
MLGYSNSLSSSNLHLVMSNPHLNAKNIQLLQARLHHSSQDRESSSLNFVLPLNKMSSVEH